MKQIRQVVVQRSLAMTIDDRGGGLQRGSSQLDRALEITRTSVGEREVVQRGDTSSRIVYSLGDRETLLEVTALAREDPENVVRLRECVVVSGALRESERLLSETDGPWRVPAAMRREAPVARDAGATAHVLLAA